MRLIERKVSLLDGRGDLETLHTLPSFPVFMSCVDHPRSQDLVADQTWDICRNTGIIQLKHLIPLDVLYQAQHCSVVGEQWMRHHRTFAEFIKEAAPKRVLELGGAHGVLSRCYAEVDDAAWTILEPNPAPAENVTATYLRGFFDRNFTQIENYDTIVHSHVLEHMYDPDEGLATLAALLSGNQRMVFAAPHLEEWFKRKFTNAINFEHSVYLTEVYIDYLLARHGFKVLRKQYFGDGHSIFYDARREESVPPVRLPEDLYQKNKQTFQEYVNYHVQLIERLNRELRSSAEKVYLFGAHVFSQYLLAFGLDAERLISILDNNPQKHGRRLYGTDLMVESPEVLRGLSQPKVILKAGMHSAEIKGGIVSGINSSAIFLE
jgi:hypothetical protein